MNEENWETQCMISEKVELRIMNTAEGGGADDRQEGAEER